MPAEIIRWAEYERAIEENKNSQIKEELKACPGIEQHVRAKLRQFLIEKGIRSIFDNEMGYPLRMEYEDYLEVDANKKRSYLKAYDRVIQYVIQKQRQTLEGKRRYEWKYQNTVLFLRYHPDPDLAEGFFDARNTERMTWDFSRDSPEKLKRQIFDTLTYIIENVKSWNCQKTKLTALQYFYDFCCKRKMHDIEALEETDLEAYHQYLKEYCINKAATRCGMVVMNLCRKLSFVRADKIHWTAGVWYLERLHLPEYRINQSKPIESISFIEIHEPENRKYAQEFMKYELGINGQAVSTIIKRYNEVRNFILYMEEHGISITECASEDLGEYFRILLEKNLMPKGYNERILEVTYFMRFLIVRKYLKPISFHPEYYYQKVIPVHHQRSVNEEVCREVIGRLKYFPEHLRCMFLHLWCLGLRGSEVCTLKGDAYYWEGKDPWIKIYQVKMKSYKRIPIPKALYDVMEVYIKHHDVKPDEYIFKNKKGGAFLYTTFRRQMLKSCEINKIQNGKYIFKSHDYRHTVATMFYDSGVSLQSIRDYLGHLYDEMTRQYIDYMPKKVEQANMEYFNVPENNLAACLKRGESYGRKKGIL